MVLLNFIPPLLKVVSQFFWVESRVEVHTQFDENLIEIVIFFLHLLMVASTLLCLSTFHEISHAFEYFIGPAKMLQNKVTVMNLQKEVVKLALLLTPVSLLDVLGLTIDGLVLGSDCAFGRFLPILFFAELDVAFLAEKGLKVVARDDLFLLLVGGVGVGGRGMGVGEGGGVVDEGLIGNGGSICIALQGRKLFGGLGSLL